MSDGMLLFFSGLALGIFFYHVFVLRLLHNKRYQRFLKKLRLKDEESGEGR